MKEPTGKEEKDITTVCKQCGYESTQNYEGYCFQCAVDKGLEENPCG